MDAGNRTIKIAVALAALATLALPGTAGAADPLRAEQWNLDTIHADSAHKTSIGTGAIVAVLDSGVDASHPDLAGNLILGPDLVDGDADPNDEHGHGTNVAGIIAARAGNGKGIEGAAPGAKVLVIRVLDRNNTGNTDREAAGIDAAVARGAQVINLSVNPIGNIVTQLLPSDRLVQAIDRAARAGVVIVASAGNQGLPLCSQPLLTSRIICVGSVNRAGKRASYSNYLLRVDIAAPGGEAQSGEDILSTGLGGTYFGMAGTSQATPHVSAAAALLVALGLRGRAVIDRLEQTATASGELLDFGHGLLNMRAAVAGLGPPLPPSTTLTARTSKRLRQARVRERGIPVVCTSEQAGTCRVVVKRRGEVIARGSREVAETVATKVRARLTAAGRRALSRSRRVGAQIEVTGPSGDVVALATTLVR